MKNQLAFGRIRHRRFHDKTHEFNSSICQSFYEVDDSKLMTQINHDLGLKVDRVRCLNCLGSLGYRFNPVSFYFCYQAGEPVACLAEVTNTPWKEQHTYCLRLEKVSEHVYAASAAKVHHVSPFLSMNYLYQFKFMLTGDKISVHIENLRDQEKHFDATLSLKLYDINLRSRLRKKSFYFLMTPRISFRIHWQALKLWLKGVKIYKHPKRSR